MIVLLEAMAAGTPVLALKATGTEDIIVNGQNGYLIQVSGDGQEEKKQDEQIFAGKLMDILEKKELDFLRQGAYQTACGYTSTQIARCAERYYKTVLWAYEEKKSRFSRNRLAGMLY